MKKQFYFFLVLSLLLAGCDKDEKVLISLETNNVEVVFPNGKTVEIFNWAGDKSKVIAKSENEEIVRPQISDNLMGVKYENRLFLHLDGDANGETTVTVSDSENNRTNIRVKSVNVYYDFLKDETTRLELNDETLKINIRKGDSNGGMYTFAREGSVATFKWENKESDKTLLLTFDETYKHGILTTGKKSDGVLTLINPQAEKEADKKISIALSYLSVFSLHGKVVGYDENGYGIVEYERAWIIFRLPAEPGQEKGTLGYCVVKLKE